MKTTRSLSVLATTVALCAAPPAAAGVPQTLVHHGHLSDAQGKPVDGSVDFKFSLHTTIDQSQNNPLWSEEIKGYPVTSGYYALALGTTSSFGDVFEKNADLWLEIAVNGQTLSPRQKVSAVPWALVAGDAIGDIHPTSISIQHTKVIDEAGKWVGDPSWIPGIKSVTATAPLTGGTITDSGTIGLGKADGTVDGYLAAADWARFDAKQERVKGTCNVGYCIIGVDPDGTPQCFPCGTGTGTVTEIDTGTGLKGGPIIQTGTIDLDKTVLDLWYVNQDGDSVPGPLAITTVGGLKVGTNQLVCDNAGNVGIGTATPATKLHVAGDVTIDGSLSLGSGGLLGNLVKYAEDDTETNTALATFKDKVSVSLDAGTWLVSATADVRTATATYYVQYRLYNTTDTAVVFGPTVVSHNDVTLTTNVTPVIISKRVVLAGTKTITLQFARGTYATTAYMKNARITALKID